GEPAEPVGDLALLGGIGLPERWILTPDALGELLGLRTLERGVHLLLKRAKRSRLPVRQVGRCAGLRWMPSGHSDRRLPTRHPRGQHLGLEALRFLLGAGDQLVV